MYSIKSIRHDDYVFWASRIAKLHGRQRDSVSIDETVDPGSLHYIVMDVAEHEVLAAFKIRSNAVVGSFDFGGFTARPGYGGSSLDSILSWSDRNLSADALTLDRFDKGGFLPKLYAGRGFREYARESYDVDTYEPLADGSTPDVVFMRRDTVR